MSQTLFAESARAENSTLSQNQAPSKVAAIGSPNFRYPLATLQLTGTRQAAVLRLAVRVESGDDDLQLRDVRIGQEASPRMSHHGEKVRPTRHPRSSVFWHAIR